MTLLIPIDFAHYAAVAQNCPEAGTRVETCN